ncbi:UDP-N-acetylmuramoylalanyl-D-glutamate--2,6-diaminopimelate ligase [Bryocella elongata]|uniref:UDP-N-acetylmuramoyl-L-alanyl-D-glutamate--2,6-diaminopimelate ligase n=1 Tax=Bryocella elongata TaxID=863522 RepID=A0A1H6B3R2_9BACT|nr:UDP-N-acetylmuramoyl-L-alanyl-D-glutamate--2,6-diaminopimelate ligase [Bryocella elongata]SEG54776.1 UDP-N-acetylmuramoylalanyl-D-glutamate--2,6-diaminopimelate ligase [Bryocella elongata]
MQWTEAIADVTTLETAGPSSVAVTGVQYDSRRVVAGDVFVAMRGGTTDGNRYVDAAIAKGASAIVTDTRETFNALKVAHPALALALVGEGHTAGRRALAEISAAVFGHPEQKLGLIAVTGTNGKTTTTLLTEQLLRSVGRRSVLIGTIEVHVGDEVRESPHTTPESRDVLEIFAEGVAAGCTEAVMEMSSHALDQERVWKLPVDVAIFTNLTQDHLDYHVTMERYAAAKARLFEGVGAPAPRVVVLNADDPYCARMAQARSDTAQVMRYGIEAWVEAANYRAVDVELHAGETNFFLATPKGAVEITMPLTGRVNVYNFLAAACAAMARGMTMEEIAVAAPTLKQVPGRFEVVAGSREANFTVVVDYAHTDDALKNLLILAHDLVSPHGGNVITLFGCGGDRDRTKRPKMGRVAAAESDLVVVTSDNPRSEDPSAIIQEIVTGMMMADGSYMGDFVVEEDRRAAIEVAIRAAKPGDIVLLAGKGHEKTQIFADHTVPFDDVAEAARVLETLQGEQNA